MSSREMLSVLSSLLLCSLSTGQQLGLSEGEACGTAGWRCRRPDACTSITDVAAVRPQICSFQGSTPVICCPPTPAQLNQSKAATMCFMYTQILCGHSGLGGARFSRAIPDELETVNRPSVVGGEPAPPRVHRHMALIGYGERPSIQWKCGGSVISSNYVLSAAHCANSPDMGEAKWVRVGELDLASVTEDSSPQDVAVVERVIHPSYAPPKMYYDIALFKLERHLIFSPWVGPACLTFDPLLPKTKATATGWGRTDIAMESSSHLLAVDLSLVEAEECRTLLGTSRGVPQGIDRDTMLCAGEKEGGKDACTGDSGGPLVVNSTDSCLKSQIGIISFGRLCALPDTPGVYTRVYHYLRWIESIVWP